MSVLQKAKIIIPSLKCSFLVFALFRDLKKKKNFASGWAPLSFCIEHRQQKKRRLTSLSHSLFMWRSGMNQTASCDAWSWKPSARELFKAVQVHRQLLPSKTDARCALKDHSLAQSLCTGRWRLSHSRLWWHDWSQEEYTKKMEMGGHKAPFWSILLTGN